MARMLATDPAGDGPPPSPQVEDRLAAGSAPGQSSRQDGRWAGISQYGGKKPLPARWDGKVPDGQLEKKERKPEKKAQEQPVRVGVGRRQGNVDCLLREGPMGTAERISTLSRTH
ncbi:hypothetical protein Y1Q_0008388 [Alligator mississippiensis]|uniref:Uncharacterized protein n=1 Tax=Alligator mississippiensis TaxID=8496 RepID=A0A151P959_ALLMI|nr:hypothetical protein Y1Q_0008388 [Alligator mississippiensis]